MKTGNFAEIKKLIKRIKKKKYQIRLSGGTSLNRKFNSIVIAILIDSYRRLFIAVVPYEPYLNVKKNIYVDFIENGAELAVRKLKEEVGFNANTKDLIFLDEDSVLDNESNDGSLHIKYAYYIERFTGNFIDLTNSSFLTRKTYNPFWIPAFLVPGVIFKKHLDLFEKLIDKLFESSKINQEDFEILKRKIKRRRDVDFFKDELKKRKNNILAELH